LRVEGGAARQRSFGGGKENGDDEKVIFSWTFENVDCHIKTHTWGKVFFEKRKGKRSIQLG